MNGQELERLLPRRPRRRSGRGTRHCQSGRLARGKPSRSCTRSRLTPEQTEEIQRIADSAGVPAADIVRGWVLQGLAAEHEDSVDQTLGALSRDVTRLRRQLIERQAS